MATPPSNKHRRSPGRFSEALFDRLGARPLGIIVFVLSALALIAITRTSAGKFSAPAIAHGYQVDHPARSDSFIEQVYVHPGDAIQTGAPLVALSSQLLERQLEQIDAEIARVQRLAELEQLTASVDLADAEWDRQVDLTRARLQLDQAEADEQYGDTVSDLFADYLQRLRDRVERRLGQASDLEEAELDQGRARAEARQGSRRVHGHESQVNQLEQALQAQPTPEEIASFFDRYYQAELQSLAVQRQAILDDREGSIIHAQADGRVVMVLPVGAPVAFGTSVATIMPEHPTEIVAYLDPSQPPDQIQPGSQVTIVSETTHCPDPAQVLRRGGMVMMAPGQLNDVLNRPVWGYPIHISIPPSCQLGVGQRVSVEFAAVQR
ncbi:MAG: hypothetical protein JW797_03030 [Bradymonadales bacterium]|nr:hypothetical protein [Bradymonadales bacterium]